MVRRKFIDLFARHARCRLHSSTSIPFQQSCRITRAGRTSRHATTTAGSAPDPSSSSSLVPQQRQQIIESLTGLLNSSRDTNAASVSTNGDTSSLILTDPDGMESYTTDWLQQYRGDALAVVFPTSTQQVSSILKYCHEHRIGVTPQSGNTGLVGGSVPAQHATPQIVLNLTKLNRIHGIHNASVLVCDAGCIVQDLQDYARSHAGLVLPLDLGSKGSCCIGGTVATNAGGSYYWRYGSLQANILGLEAVLADGTVLDMMNLNMKNNTGYKLRQLFVGSEGTLGVVTKVALHCPRHYPASRQVLLLSCRTYADVVALLQSAKSELNDILAAFEYMDKGIVEMVLQEHGDKRLPSIDAPFTVLLETHGSNAEHDMEKMEKFLEKHDDRIDDGILAQDLQQAEECWHLRELCSPTVASLGYVYKYDLSLPIPQFQDFVDHMRMYLEANWNDPVEVVNWGHVVDGNIHTNIVMPGVFEKEIGLLNLLEPYIFEKALEFGGSISAEHGLGQCKNDYMHQVYGADEGKAATLEMMLRMKRVFDERNILNPGKYFPSK